MPTLLDAPIRGRSGSSLSLRLAELDYSMIAYLGIWDRDFSNPNHTISVDDQAGKMKHPVTVTMRCGAVQFDFPKSNVYVTAFQRAVRYQPVAKDFQ